jgi:chromosome segregation ATPase
LSFYALIVGALVVVLAALAAWALLRDGGLMRRGRSYAWLNLPNELPAILSDFEDAIERSRAEAQRAAKVSEAIMAAAKSIEIALKDFKTRIADLEKRMDGGEKQSEDMKKLLMALQTSSADNSRALAGIEVRLTDVGKQLPALTDQFSGLKQLTESGASQHTATGERLRSINDDLAAVGSEVARLSQRLGVEETGQARLSVLSESLAKSLSALKADAEKAAQDIAALEPRLLWKIEALQTLVNSLAVTTTSPPIGDDMSHENSPDADHIAPR